MFLSTVSHAFRSISHLFYEEVCLKCQTKVSCFAERSMQSWSDELPPRMFTHFRPLFVRPYCYCRLRKCETWNHKIEACVQVLVTRTCAENSFILVLIPFLECWEIKILTYRKIWKRNFCQSRFDASHRVNSHQHHHHRDRGIHSWGGILPRGILKISSLNGWNWIRNFENAMFFSERIVVWNVYVRKGSLGKKAP